jgi:hypothetical protein
MRGDRLRFLFVLGLFFLTLDTNIRSVLYTYKH